MTRAEIAARDQAIVKEYREGASQAQCATRFKLSNQQISFILKKLGVEVRKPSRGVSTPVVGKGTRTGKWQHQETKCALCGAEVFRGGNVCMRHEAIVDDIVFNSARKRGQRVAA